MKILLTTLNSKYIHSSLALKYLEKYILDNNKIESIVKEFTINQNIGYIVGEIYREQPNIIGFSTYIWNIEEILEIINTIKLVLPDVIIVVGGPEVSFEIEEIMKKI